MLVEWTFIRPTDCVAFCPVSGFQDLLAVGCYELDPSSNERRGNIHLLRIQPRQGSLHFDGSTELAGVLDLQWRPDTDKGLLASASADGVLRIFDLDPATRMTSDGSLIEFESSQVHEQVVSEGIVLSLDWTSAGQIYTSTSDGYLGRVECSPHGMEMTSSFKGHDLEVWTIASDIHNSDIVFSGSDDCSFKGWDLRADHQLMFSKCKDHAAGVCTIAMDPWNTSILATGSYDEYLRVWDLRMMSTPVLVHQVPCGGGVWRIRYHPMKEDCLALACMHDGFKILASQQGAEMTIIEEYKAHGSLAYGVDWHKGNSEILATCSFYDGLLHVWTTSQSNAMS